MLLLAVQKRFPCLDDVAAIDAADPRLDHRVVKATLKVEGIFAMLPLEAFMRPVRLNMRAWKSKALDWQKAVSAEIEQSDEGDCFKRLERLKAVANSQAVVILGVTGGRMRSFIPFHSSHLI